MSEPFFELVATSTVCACRFSQSIASTVISNCSPRRERSFDVENATIEGLWVELCLMEIQKTEKGQRLKRNADSAHRQHPNEPQGLDK